MNEHSFIKSIHRHLPNDLITWKINDQFAGGVPDAFYAGDKGLIFIEYKFRPKFPVKDTSLMGFGLKPQQINWLNSLKNKGISTAVVAGCQDLVIITANYFSLANITKGQFMGQTLLTRKDAAKWISDSCLDLGEDESNGICSTTRVTTSSTKPSQDMES